MNETVKKKTLLVLASTYPRWLNDHEPGFVHELSKRLTDKFDVRVITPHSPGAKEFESLDGVNVYRYRYAPSALETLVNDGGMVSNLQKSPWKVFLLPFFFLSQLVAVGRSIKAQKVDVVHAHWLIPQGLTLTLLSYFIKLPPFLVTSHGADLFALKGWLFRKLKLLITQKATQVSVVSKVMKTELTQLGVPENKISVMPMGVDMNCFHIDDTVSRSACELLFVGRLVEKKGLNYLISSMAEIKRIFPKVHLTVIGFGPEEIRMKKQASTLNLIDNITFLGAVPHKNLAKYYQRASVFVAPFIEAKSGDQEGLGLVLVEAASCGCPIIVSDIEACKDVISCLQGVSIFSAGSCSSLTHAVCQTLSNIPHHTRLIKKSTAELSEQFNWTSVANKYGEKLAETMRIFNES